MRASRDSHHGSHAPSSRSGLGWVCDRWPTGAWAVTREHMRPRCWTRSPQTCSSLWVVLACRRLCSTCSASPCVLLGFCRVSWPWSFLNQVRVHAFQDGFAALILHPRRQSQESDVGFGQHFTDLQFSRDRVPNEDRLEKAGGLFDQRDDGPFQHRGKR
jgi:hypothetical protein